MREKLIEILRVPIYPHLDADPAEVVADYLLDNGVTIATDNNVGDKMSPTNADRIRAMSDEELAKELAKVAGWDRKQYEKAKFIGIEKVIHNWLKQPAQEVDDG